MVSFHLINSLLKNVLLQKNFKNLMSWIKFKTTNLLKSILKTNFPENNDA